MSAIEAVGGVARPDAGMPLDATRLAAQVEQRRMVTRDGTDDPTSSGGFLGRSSLSDRRSRLADLARTLHVDEGVLGDQLAEGRRLAQVLADQGATEGATMPVQLQGILFDRYL